MMSFRLILLLPLTLAASGLSAAVLEHTALPVSAKYGYATDTRISLEASVRAAPEAELSLGPGHMRISARLWADGQDLLEPGRPDLSSYSRASEPWELGDWGRIELRDTYIETTAGNHLFRFGKQQIVWGALDGLKVLDVLNPQNFREFILEDFGESRIGLWSAYADLLFDTWRAELAWIPDTTTHEVPVSGAWFELTAPRFRYGASPDDPGLPSVTERPAAKENTLALRISRSFGGTELSAQFVSGIDFEPLGRIVLPEGEPLLENYHDTRDLYGLKLETAIAGMALRFEVSYQPQRSFNVRDGMTLQTARLDQWRAAMGIDLDGPLGTFFSIQYLHDQVMKAPATLIRPEIDRLVTFFARRAFAYDTVTLELRWYGEINRKDGMARASLSYEVGANTSIELSGDYFYGCEEGLFGQFAERDRIQLVLQHAF